MSAPSGLGDRLLAKFLALVTAGVLEQTKRTAHPVGGLEETGKQIAQQVRGQGEDGSARRRAEAEVSALCFVLLYGR